MRYYRLTPSSDDFSSFVADTGIYEDLYLRFEGDCGVPSELDSKGIEPVAETRGAPLGDFPALFLHCIMMSNRARSALSDLISNHVVFHTFRGKLRDFTIAQVCRVLDVADEAHSELSVNSVTGNVSAIHRYAFRNIEKVSDVPVFRVPETKGLEVIVSDEFRSAVERASLKGLEWSKVIA